MKKRFALAFAAIAATTTATAEVRVHSETDICDLKTITRMHDATSRGQPVVALNILQRAVDSGRCVTVWPGQRLDGPFATKMVPFGPDHAFEYTNVRIGDRSFWIRSGELAE